MGFLDKPMKAPDDYKTKFTFVEDYLCPKCGEEPQFYYEIETEGFPKCFNDRTFQSDWGDQRTWEEYYICEVNNCKTKFWFENGN